MKPASRNAWERKGSRRMHTITKREKVTYTGSLLGQNMIYSMVTMYVMFFLSLIHI